MRRGLIMLSLAVVAAVPVLAQITPMQIRRPAPVIVPVTPVQQAPGNAGVIEPWMTPETAKAAIEKLRAEKRALREQMAVTLADLQNARTTLDEMTSRGGSLVRAQCVSETLSRRTDGSGEENCAASGYTCGDVEGTCHRQCTTSAQCAGAAGFRCDTSIGRCTLPPTGD